MTIPKPYGKLKEKLKLDGYTVNVYESYAPLKDKYTVVFHLLKDEEKVGYCYIDVWEVGPALIKDFIIFTPYRGMGLGIMFYEKIEEYMIKNFKPYFFHVEVSPKNGRPAIIFWEKMGFRFKGNEGYKSLRPLWELYGVTSPSETLRR